MLDSTRSVKIHLLALALALAGSATPQQAQQENPAFAKVVDRPGLARVLLIGDSISIGYTAPVRKLLEGKANVHRIPVNGGPTTRGLENIDSWLDEGNWDAVHFNWGLHDLKFMESGERQVSLDDYKKNLEALTVKLKKTGAKLIWASTTPVPDGKLSPPRRNRDVIAYNAAAAEIMERHGVAADDLYSFAAPRLEAIQRPANVHFTAKGSAKLAERVAASILAALPAAHSQKAKRIVFVAGSPSHGYGAHEHRAGMLLLARLLGEAYPGLRTVVAEKGWPADESVLEGADAIVINCDGGRHVADKRWERVTAMAEAGMGLALIHYAVEGPTEKAGEAIREWIGGNFERGMSVNPHWTPQFGSFPDHPAARGLTPFALNDEWYFNMKFQPARKGVTPILSAPAPLSVLLRKDDPHGGNPGARAAVRGGDSFPVAWVYERPGGGRGFGFTGAHFHDNYADDNFRKAVLNGIAWTAGLDIPPAGVSSKRPTSAELAANQDYDRPADWAKRQGELPGDAEPVWRGRAGERIELPLTFRRKPYLYLIVRGEGGTAKWAQARFIGASGVEAPLVGDPWAQGTSDGVRIEGDALVAPVGSLAKYHLPQGAVSFSALTRGPADAEFLLFVDPPAEGFLP